MQPNALTVIPLEPCHSCHVAAPCFAVPVVRYSSGWECSACRTTRWGGVTHPSGPRVIGLACAGNTFICWCCVEAFTPPDRYIPEISYVKGPVAPIYTQSEYKNDAWCDECGYKINPER